jgi:hypothetical protein
VGERNDYFEKKVKYYYTISLLSAQTLPAAIVYVALLYLWL